MRRRLLRICLEGRLRLNFGKAGTILKRHTLERLIIVYHVIHVYQGYGVQSSMVMRIQMFIKKILVFCIWTLDNKRLFLIRGRWSSKESQLGNSTVLFSRVILDVSRLNDMTESEFFTPMFEANFFQRFIDIIDTIRTALTCLIYWVCDM